MSRSLRRGALAAALALSLAPFAAACAASDDAQTLQIRPDNAATTVGDIKIQNAVVLTTPGEGGGTAVVSARIFNDGNADQTIEAVKVGSGTVTAKLAGAEGASKIVVPAQGTILLGGEGNPSATLPTDDSTENGDYQKVVFDFSDTGEVAIEANVQPASGYFEPYGPSGTPAATPSATTEAGRQAEGSASPSSTGSAAETTEAAAHDAHDSDD